tara:strand:+ start:4109 stop:4516 length:408 start_codon:yes stop_codon:yes gene_type:complete
MIETIEQKANTAFERSENYQFLGEPITWSYRHEWLWVEISRASGFQNEKDALLMMWLGGLQDPKDLKAIKYKHRKDPHEVIDEFEDYCEQFRINGNEVEEAITVCQEILTDIDASTNEIEPNTDVEKEAAKPPKK